MFNCMWESKQSMVMQDVDDQARESRYAQIGVMSMGAGNCGGYAHDYRGVFVKVENFLDWIKSTAKI